MPKSRATVRAYKVPLSGKVIGTLVKELRLEANALRSRTAKRYYSGQRVKDTTKVEVIGALAQALVEEDVFPPSPFLDREGISLKNVLAVAIAWYAMEWDRLAGYMHSVPTPVERPDIAGTAYLRLVTIDMALRISAAMWLAEIPTPAEGTPLWAEERGNANHLKRLLSLCGASAPTRDQLAEDLNVSLNTVDSWLDTGARPSKDHNDSIAEKLAPRLAGTDSESLKRQLHLTSALSSICDLLASHIGRDAVTNVATALMRFVSRSLDGLRKFSHLPPEDAAKAQFLILVSGAKFAGCEYLLRALWRREADAVWRTDLQAVTKPWHLRLTHIMQHLGGLDQVVELAQEQYGISMEDSMSLLDRVLRDVQADPTMANVATAAELEDMTVLRIKGDARYSAGNRMIQYEQARSEGNLCTAILHVRRAVQLQPENADYHFHLGATLGMAGKIDEGIQECWIATQLDPFLETSRVEVGIILLNAGRNEEARDQLESIADGQRALSPHLAFNLGVARYRCGEIKGALDVLSGVIAIEPNHAMALDVCAHCAFVLGQTKLGLRLAKRAHVLGFSESYLEWHSGKYRSVKGNSKE